MADDFLNRGTTTAVVSDKRAASDEAIQDTLPQEGLQLTERKAPDLSSAIEAEESKNGLYLSPELQDGLQKIAGHITDTRRVTDASEADKNIADEKANLEMLNFYKGLNAEMQFKAWFAKDNTESRAKLEDKLRSADQSSWGSKVAVLKEWLEEQKERMNQLASDGYIAAADAVRANTEELYTKNIGKAISDDTKKISDFSLASIDTQFQSATDMDVQSGRITADEFKESAGNNVRKAMLLSSGIDTYEDYNRTLSNYNKSAVTYVDAIKYNFDAGNITLDQAKTALYNFYALGLPSNVYSYEGIRGLTQSDRYVLNNARREGIAESAALDKINKSGTPKDAKVYRMAPGEIYKYDERLANSPELLEAMFGAPDEEGKYLVAKLKWDMPLDDTVQKHILSTINQVTEKGAKASIGDLDLFAKAIDLEGLKKGNFQSNSYLNGMTFENYKSYIEIPAQAALSDILQNGTEDQREAAIEKYIDITSYGRAYYVSRAFNSDLGYSSKNGGAAAVRGKISELDEILLDSGGSIPDHIDALVFKSQDGTIICDMNMPSEMWKYLPQEKQNAMKVVFLNNVKKGLESTADAFEKGGINVTKVKVDSNYNKALSGVKQYIAPSAFTLIDNNGEVKVNQDSVNQASAQLRNAYNAEVGISGNKTGAVTLNDTLTEAAAYYKNINTAEGRFAYIYALALSLSKAGISDTTVTSSFATFTGDNKKFATEALGLVFLANSEKGATLQPLMAKAAKGKYWNLSLSALQNAADNGEIKLDSSWGKGIIDKVSSTIQKYNVDPQYREALYDLAQKGIAVAAEGNGGFTASDFEDIIKKNFNNRGEYTQDTPYTGGGPSPSGKENSKQDWADSAKEVERTLRDKTLESGATIKDGKILDSKGMPITYFNGVSNVDVVLPSSTGGLSNSDAIKVKTAAAAGILNMNAIIDEPDNANVRALYQKDKTLYGYDPKNASVTFGKLRTQMCKPDNIVDYEREVAKAGYVPGHMRSGIDASVAEAIAGLRNKSKGPEYLRIKDYVNFSYNNMSGKTVLPTTHSTAPSGAYNKVTGLPVIKVGGNYMGYTVSRGLQTAEENKKATGADRPHMGVDVYGYYNKNGTTTPFKANSQFTSPVTGTVQKVGYEAKGFGNYVIISTGNNERYVLAHFNSISVKAGDKVEVGKSVVGRLGATGFTKGASALVHIEKQRKKTDKSGHTYWGILNPATNQEFIPGKKSLAQNINPSDIEYDPTFIAAVIKNGITQTRKMGYFNLDMKDTNYIYDNFRDYVATKEDAIAVGRKGELNPEDMFHNQGSLAARLAMGREIFRKSNIDDHKQIALAAIHPGVKLNFVSYEHKPLLQNKSLNDIISMHKYDGLRDYSKNVGSWVLPKKYEDVAQKVIEFYRTV